MCLSAPGVGGGRGGGCRRQCQLPSASCAVLCTLLGGLNQCPWAFRAAELGVRVAELGVAVAGVCGWRRCVRHAAEIAARSAPTECAPRRRRAAFACWGLRAGHDLSKADFSRPALPCNPQHGIALQECRNASSHAHRVPSSAALNMPGMSTPAGCGAGADTHAGLEFVDRISCHGAKWREELRRRRTGLADSMEDVSPADDEFLNGSREARLRSLTQLLPALASADLQAGLALSTCARHGHKPLPRVVGLVRWAAAQVFRAPCCAPGRWH